MPGVVANLVHVRGNAFCESVVLLQVDRKPSGYLAANLHQRFGILAAVNGDPHNVRPGVVERIDLRNSRIDVLRSGRSHTLNRDRMSAAD